jgi:chitin disaccharide deacetylase
VKPKRSLIINADDFGQSPGVNRGIIEAHERGIVTSTSLMVRWPAAREAARYARTHPELSVGLHLDLGERAFRDGSWVFLYIVVPRDDKEAIEAEVQRQLDAFRHLMDRNPTHMDSHQHAHRVDPVQDITREVACQLRIPLRDSSRKVRYWGKFYGQGDDGAPYPDGITLKQLIKIFQELPLGYTELGCHPGRGRDLDTMYLCERELELKVLCHPRAREVIQEMGIELRSFNDLAPMSQTRKQAALVS